MDIWLWSACWHDLTPMAMMSSFMMEPMMLEAETYLDVYSDTIYVNLNEALEFSLEGQLYRIADIIKWLENMPVDYPEMMAEIDMDEWNEFLEKLYSEELQLLVTIHEVTVIRHKKQVISCSVASFDLALLNQDRGETVF